MDTEEGDIALETQQDSDSRDEDIGDTQDAQAAGRTQKGKARERASQRPRKDRM